MFRNLKFRLWPFLISFNFIYLFTLNFQKNYFFAALLLFLLLVFIAVYISDTIIRPYGGDVLVVIFLYCLLKSFFKIPVKNAIFGVLLFAFLLEGLQAFDLVGRLGVQGNPVAVTVLGNHFDFDDLLLYLLGGAITFLAEIFLLKKSS